MRRVAILTGDRARAVRLAVQPDQLVDLGRQPRPRRGASRRSPASYAGGSSSSGSTPTTWVSSSTPSRPTKVRLELKDENTQCVGYPVGRAADAALSLRDHADADLTRGAALCSSAVSRLTRFRNLVAPRLAPRRRGRHLLLGRATAPARPACSRRSTSARPTKSFRTAELAGLPEPRHGASGASTARRRRGRPRRALELGVGLGAAGRRGRCNGKAAPLAEHLARAAGRRLDDGRARAADAARRRRAGASRPRPGAPTAGVARRCSRATRSALAQKRQPPRCRRARDANSTAGTSCSPRAPSRSIAPRADYVARLSAALADRSLERADCRIAADRARAIGRRPRRRSTAPTSRRAALDARRSRRAPPRPAAARAAPRRPASRLGRRTSSPRRLGRRAQGPRTGAPAALKAAPRGGAAGRPSCSSTTPTAELDRARAGSVWALFGGRRAAVASNRPEVWRGRSEVDVWPPRGRVGALEAQAQA